MKRGLFPVLLLLALVAPAWAAEYVQDEIIVRYTPAYQMAWKATKESQKLRGRPNSGRINGLPAPGQSIRATVDTEIPELDMRVLKLPKGLSVATAISRYSTQSHVLYAEPNYISRYTAVPNDAQYGQQWQHPITRAPEAWDLTTGLSSVVISVIDSGVQLDHPDLQPKLLPGFDFVDEDADPSDTGGVGHGTFVSGMAAAATNNGIGVAAPGWNSMILPIRSGGFFLLDDDVNQGLMYSIAQGVDIINMSFGGPVMGQARQDALDACVNAGIILVAATGNDNTNQQFYPAAYPPVIAVSATNSNDQKAWFSNYGDWVDIAAPGEAVRSTVMGSGYDVGDGTSYASPFVAGAISLMVAYAPNATPAQIREALESTAAPVGNWLPTGRIDIEAALLDLPNYISELHVPSSASMMDGTHAGGAVESLAAIDGQNFTITGTRTPDRAATATFMAEATVELGAGRLRGVLLNVTSSGPAVSQLLFAYNWTTGRWDHVGSSRFSPTGRTQTIDLGSTPLNYRRADGVMRIALRAIDGPGQLSSITCNVDQFAVTVNIEN